MAKSASRKRREKQAKKGSGKKPGSEGRKDPPFEDSFTLKYGRRTGRTPRETSATFR